jgi:hypothetical protein
MEPVSANSTERQSVVWLTDRVRRSACDWDRRMLRAARRTVPCRSARYCPHLRQASGASAGCVISSIVKYPARRNGEMPDEHTDEWSQTIALLDRVAARQNGGRSNANHPWPSGKDHLERSRYPDRPRGGPDQFADCHSVMVRSAVWLYGHQSWRASLAKRSGNCVLSGAPIRRGTSSINRPPDRRGRAMRGQ